MTHQIVEIIYKSVANLYKMEWQDIQIKKFGKFTGYPKQKAKEARAIIAYLLSKNLSNSFAAEICNVKEDTVKIYKDETHELMLSNPAMAAIITNINNKVANLRKTHDTTTNRLRAIHSAISTLIADNELGTGMATTKQRT